MENRKKILFLSDHPLVPSGVGTQSKYLLEGLLATEKYRFLCFGGAIKHPNYNPQMIEPQRFGENNWVIVPVDGYGTKDMVRQVLDFEKPDAMVIFTDPRFFYWVWEMEDEIRSVCPLLYWHVWDGDPTPEYNRGFYESTDHIACISMKTYGIMQDLGYKRASYVPHGLPDQLFKPLPEAEVEEFRAKHLGRYADRKFILFWNNRNARRKRSGDVVAAFSKFMKRVGRDNVALMLHTAPDDPEGQDLLAVAKKFDCDGELIVSSQRVPPEVLNSYYNAVDATINISSAEGFGLGTLESLFAGTPIVAHFTGGLQFQVGDWWEGLTDFADQEKMTALAKKRWHSRQGKWWGVPVFPAARSVTGAQAIPYIYEDLASHEDIVDGLVKLYEMGRGGRKRLGLEAREWARRRFSLDSMVSSWDGILEREIATYRENKGKARSFRLATL